MENTIQQSHCQLMLVLPTVALWIREMMQESHFRRLLQNLLYMVLKAHTLLQVFLEMWVHKIWGMIIRIQIPSTLFRSLMQNLLGIVEQLVTPLFLEVVLLKFQDMQLICMVLTLETLPVRII